MGMSNVCIFFVILDSTSELTLRHPLLVPGRGSVLQYSDQYSSLASYISQGTYQH